MSLPKYPILLPSAVAQNGDRADIPTYGTGGSFSYNLGFPTATQTPLAAGGVPPSRADFNGIFHELSQHTFYQQSGGMYAWSAELDYPNNAVVYGSNNVLYKAIQESGKNHSVGAKDPLSNSAYWERVTLAIPDGSTSTKGILQLYNGINSTSTSYAATAASVKTAYDEARKATSKAYVSETNNSSYVKLSNGLIMQWGTHTLQGQNATCTLATAFTTTTYYVNWTMLEPITTTTGFGYNRAPGVVKTQTTTNFSFTGLNESGRTVRWFAIGK